VAGSAKMADAWLSRSQSAENRRPPKVRTASGIVD
jgi:hypothetical protein